MIGVGLVGLVALIHLVILAMEMFLWETPTVRGVFRISPEFAANTRVLAANQGLYNGFLAAGLILALLRGLPGPGAELAQLILACVVVAGLYGAATVGRPIAYVQAMPAVLALAAVMAGI